MLKSGRVLENWKEIPWLNSLLSKAWSLWLPLCSPEGLRGNDEVRKGRCWRFRRQRRPLRIRFGKLLLITCCRDYPRGKLWWLWIVLVGCSRLRISLGVYPGRLLKLSELQLQLLRLNKRRKASSPGRPWQWSTLAQQVVLTHNRNFGHRLSGGSRGGVFLKFLVEDRHWVGPDALAQFSQLGVEPGIVSGMLGCKVSQALHCKSL